MKIEKDRYIPDCSRLVFHFVQDGNTLGTTDKYEELEIEVESQEADITNGVEFYTLRTDTGWSFDSKEELIDIIDKVKKTIQHL